MSKLNSEKLFLGSRLGDSFLVNYKATDLSELTNGGTQQQREEDGGVKATPILFVDKLKYLPSIELKEKPVEQFQEDPKDDDLGGDKDEGENQNSYGEVEGHAGDGSGNGVKREPEAAVDATDGVEEPPMKKIKLEHHVTDGMQFLNYYNQSKPKM